MPRFQPAASATLAVSAVSAHVAIPKPGQPGLLLQNDGATAAFVRWGGDVQTAGLSDLPVLAGQSIVVRTGNSGDIAAITVSGTTILRISSGSGMIPRPGGAQGTGSLPPDVIVRGIIDPN
jgi:hypothetical protein